METVEERSILNSSIYTVKSNAVEESTVVAVESSVCHKSNGVDNNGAENEEKAENDNNKTENEVKDEISNEQISDDVSAEADKVNIPAENLDPELINESVESPESDNMVKPNTQQNHSNVMETCEVVTEVTIDDNGVESEPADIICEEIVTETTVEVTNTESATSEVKFMTEILVEKNDNDINENVMMEGEEQDSTPNILSELDSNIELSEVLRSSDVTEEDNESKNETIRHEVFNKEELLDILEGNDNDQSTTEATDILPHEKKFIEAQIALKQLSRLKGTKRKLLCQKTKRDKKSNSIKKAGNFSEKKLEKDGLKQGTDKTIDVQKQSEDEKQPATGNIVSALVMDWDDDEPVETKETDPLEEEDKSQAKPIDQAHDNNEEVTHPEGTNQACLDSTTSEDNVQNVNRSSDDGPPRRISRVIKKKVIFDPDNPDTFTKGKTPLKNKEGTEHAIPKKPKLEVRQRSKSKSPMSKLQWKKPSPKNSKQNKRLTEVDRLLMDEGAVNMLYQLTPDAPKGKKNMKTKAEIIKKLQSSTPETKEMKFRERKKEMMKYEDGEAKRILVGKLRTSLSSSVKSPTVSEDFETHSADDSIIYRRHSSSSYSSSCMSPRRLSDVETGSVHNAPQINPKIKEKLEEQLETKDQQAPDAFMAGSAHTPLGKEMINKSDCLSIKERLNSKLSQALNKRKREITKIEKPIKQKKLSKDIESHSENLDQFKFVSIVIENRLAIVCIKKTSVKIGVEVIRELEEALLYLDKMQNISVTLLSSECGVLCSSFDLNLLLEDNKETRVKQAYMLADSIRLLLCSAAQHSKLLCCSVWGACCGVGLALATLSDVVLASECATFALSMGSAPLFPGTAALTARCQALSQALINDLVIFGRRISSMEALQSGLISRTLWPDRFEEQVSNIVKDIAAQPTHTILLKKKLLNLKNTNNESTLFSCLEAERDLLVEYWTSVEGQELLRATLDIV